VRGWIFVLKYVLGSLPGLGLAQGGFVKVFLTIPDGCISRTLCLCRLGRGRFAGQDGGGNRDDEDDGLRLFRHDESECGSGRWSLRPPPSGFLSRDMLSFSGLLGVMRRVWGPFFLHVFQGKKVDGAANAYAINVSQKRKYRFVPRGRFWG